MTLSGRHKPRTQHCPVCAKSQHVGDICTIGQAARGDDRNTASFRYDDVQQLPQWD